MSSTLCFPIKYILSVDDKGERVLHPAVSIDYLLLESENGIHLAPYWGINVHGGSTLELYLSDRQEDPYYQDHILFTGFHSSAMNIVDLLRIPKEDYEIY